MSHSQGGQPGWSEGNPGTDFFSVGGTNFARYVSSTNTWTTEAALPVSVGSWVAPQWIDADDTSLETVVRHVDYLVERMGIDHVGFGSDFEGADPPP